MSAASFLCRVKMERRHGLGLAVFCLLAGSRWLIDAAWPETLPTLFALSVRYAVVGVAASALLLLRGAGQWKAMPLMQIAGTSLLLLSVPALIGHLANGVNSETSVTLYALVPLCVVLTLGWLREDSSRAPMMPALMGLAGVMLVLPWVPPSSAGGAVSFVLVLGSVLLTAAASVWVHRALRGRRLGEVIMIVALTNAAVLGLASAVCRDHWMGWTGLAPAILSALLVDLPELALLLWLVRELAPERFAARFFLVPAATLLEGLAVLRGPVNPRISIGLLLLLFGAGALLLGRWEDTLNLDLR